MVLSLCEEIHNRNKDIKFFVIATKNKTLISNIALAYPYISIHKSTITGIFNLVPKLFQKNFFIIRPTFGKVPLIAILIGKLFTFSRGSRLVGFSQVVNIAALREKFLDIILYFNSSVIFYENISKILPLLGCSSRTTSPSYKFIKNESVFDKYSITPGGYIVLHMFAANPKRSLPDERWAEIMDFLTQNFPRVPIVCTGSSADESAAVSILKYSISKPVKVFNIPFQDVATLINSARLYIGPDTGITHLAGVLRIPSVVIGNLSNPAWLPSYNDKAIILYNPIRCLCDGKKGGDCKVLYKGREYLRCMLDIKQNDIYKAVEQAINVPLN